MRKKARFDIVSSHPTIGGKEMPVILESLGLTCRFVTYFEARVADSKKRRELAEGILWLVGRASFCEVDLRDLSPMILALGLDKMRHKGVPMEKVQDCWTAAGIFCDWMQHAGLVKENAASSVPDPIRGLFWSDCEHSSADHEVIEVSARCATPLLNLA